MSTFVAERSHKDEAGSRIAMPRPLYLKTYILS